MPPVSITITRTYTLRSLPGEFTGLQLLCYMHVSWQQVAPHLDTGFDLSKEYAQALTMHRLGQSEG